MGRSKKNKLQPIELNQESIRQQLTDVTDPNSPRKSDRGSTSKKSEGQGKKQKEPKQPPWPVYRKFLKYSLRRWQFGLLSMIVTVCSGIMDSLFPWKLGLLLDLVSKQTDNNVETEVFREKLINSMLQLALITVFIAISIFFRVITLKIFQEKISIDLRTEIYSIFIKNDLNFFQKYKTGELISRLSNDVNQAKSAISNNLTFLVRNLFNITGTLIILFMLSWRLTFVVLTIVPIYAVVTLQYTRKAKQLGRKKQDLQAEICVHVGEKFGGIQTIKSYCAQQKEIKKYVEGNMSVYDVVKMRSIYEGIHTTCSNFLPSFGALLVLLYAGTRLLNNHIQLSAGQLTSFILYCNNLSSTTAGISNSYTNIINGTSAIQKVFQMMNYERLVVQDVGKEVQISGSVEFNKVSFKYPQAESPIFKDLSFQINPGQYVAFVGQSGSGKSTVTKLIQHFYRIHEGSIFFGEHDSAEMNVKKIRKQIGLVSQEATIFSGTIEENITYGLEDYSLTDMEKAAEKAGCLDFIKNSRLFPHGYQTIVGERGVNLSGGQRQRISIARALMRKPKILIFDEATSALDSNSEDLVRQSIEELANDTSITIIVVAHRLSTVINCDRLYVMKEGNIIEVGSHRDLIRQKGYYYTLILKQLQEDYKDEQNIIKRSQQNQEYSCGQKVSKQQCLWRYRQVNPEEEINKNPRVKMGIKITCPI